MPSGTERLTVGTEIFAFPKGPDYILLLPLKGVSLLVNADTVRLLNAIEAGHAVDPNLDAVQTLRRIGVFDTSPAPTVSTTYLPTAVTLLPSFRCNLKCVYCFSNGGDPPHKMLPFHVAKAAIDLVCDNAVRLAKRDVRVGFHGGGEPLLPSNRPFVENVVGYARAQAEAKGLATYFTAATNGVDLCRFDVRWLKDHIQRFSVSLDGPAAIQNSQRPRRGVTSDSYARVLAGIELLRQAEIPFGIRATITKQSVGRMAEIVEHFAGIAPGTEIHVEPLFACGRCATSGLEAPPVREFVENFAVAHETAEALGSKVFYSGATVGKPTDHFCGAAGENFFVTPDCRVTTCLEACRTGDPYSEPFMIGRYDPVACSFAFDQPKIRHLKTRRVANIAACKSCVCKYSCAGDCLSKVLRGSGDLFDTSANQRCAVNVDLTELIISEMTR